MWATVTFITSIAYITFSTAQPGEARLAREPSAIDREDRPVNIVGGGRG